VEKNCGVSRKKVALIFVSSSETQKRNSGHHEKNQNRKNIKFGLCALSLVAKETLETLVEKLIYFGNIDSVQ
jgi:hypothetical protein